MTKSIGIDLGGTNLRIGLVDVSNGIVEEEFKISLEQKDPLIIIQTIKDTISVWGDNIPVGIGVAGWLNNDSSTVINGPNLGWLDVPFKGLWKKIIKNDLFLINDLRAIGIGEYHFGAGAGSQVMGCIFQGSGIGSTVLINGIPLKGALNMACEIGHIRIASTDGRLCGCGQRGCLEAYVGGHNIEKRVKEEINNFPDSLILKIVNGDLNKITCLQIEEAAVAGDLYANKLWNEIAFYLSIAIGGMITYFNFDILILGGGVFSGAKTLQNITLDQIKLYSSKQSYDCVKIKVPLLGHRAGIIGSSYWAYSCLTKI